MPENALAATRWKMAEFDITTNSVEDGQKVVEKSELVQFQLYWKVQQLVESK